MSPWPAFADADTLIMDGDELVDCRCCTNEFEAICWEPCFGCGYTCGCDASSVAVQISDISVTAISGSPFEDYSCSLSGITLSTTIALSPTTCGGSRSGQSTPTWCPNDPNLDLYTWEPSMLAITDPEYDCLAPYFNSWDCSADFGECGPLENCTLVPIDNPFVVCLGVAIGCHQSTIIDPITSDPEPGDVVTYTAHVLLRGACSLSGPGTGCRFWTTEGYFGAPNRLYGDKVFSASSNPCISDGMTFNLSTVFDIWPPNEVSVSCTVTFS